MLITVPEAIEERDSFYLGFKLKNHLTDEPIIPTEVKVFVFLSDTNDNLTYINGRNGTNNNGLLISGNEIKFSMSPEDNAIVSNPPFKSKTEPHFVRFNIKYNEGVDNLTVEYFLRINNLRGRV